MKKKLFFLTLLFFTFIWRPCFAFNLGTAKIIETVGAARGVAVLDRQATYETLGEPIFPPVISSNAVFIIDDNGIVYSFARDGNLKWSYETFSDLAFSPVISPDGTIYLGTADWEVYALNPDGGLKWSSEILGEPIFSPILGPDDIIYFGSEGGNVCALNSKDGSLKWDFEALGELVYSPLVGPDNVIYFGSEGGYFYALSPKGDLKWSFETLGELVFSPAISSNAVFIIDDNNTVYALNLNGSLKWDFETFGDLAFSPVIGLDDTIYLGTADWEVNALDPDGNLKWSFETPGELIASALTIDSKGAVYVKSAGGYVSTLNPNGSLKWIYEAPGELIASAPVISGKKILIGSANGISVLNADDGRQQFDYQAPAELISSLFLNIQSDGKVYFGDDTQSYSLEIEEIEETAESCSENDSGALNIEGSQGGIGDEITIPVRIQSAPNAIGTFGFEVIYPDVLEYLSFEKGVLTASFEFVSASAVIPGKVRTGGFSVTNIPLGSSGSVILLKFRVIGNPSGCYPLSLENLKDNVAQFSKSGGCFCVRACDGDQNDDGEITPADALIVFKCYLSTGPCNECSDVNQDGEVTPADALCIFKKYLGLPSCLD